MTLLSTVWARKFSKVKTLNTYGKAKLKLNLKRLKANPKFAMSEIVVDQA